MAILSGKDGTLIVDGTKATPLVDWWLRKGSDTKSYTANDTGGWRKRVSGAKDCRGGFALAVAQDKRVPVAEGQAVTLKLHVDDSGNNYYEVPARIEAIRLSVNVSEGCTVPCAVAFLGNGPIVAHGVLDPNELEVISQM